MSSMATISAKNITKNYKSVQALKGMSFEVGEGEVFGIIGPDGSGKTTLFRILTTLLLPDSGEGTVAGFDLVKDYQSIRRKVGYMPGKFSLYQDLSVEENLKVFASLFDSDIEENYHMIESIYGQLKPFKNRRASALSGGMKQKLALCCALIHKPEVLFLDEPTTGVDPVSRKELWDVLLELKEQGVSILVSTPYMDEAELCDRIALIQDGEFLKIDTPRKIKADYDQTLWAVRSANMSKLLKDLRKNKAIMSTYAFGDCHHLTVEPGFLINGFKPGQLNDFLVENGHMDIEIKSIDPGIEDCFMQLLVSK